jgi:hypothetical protein
MELKYKYNDTLCRAYKWDYPWKDGKVTCLHCDKPCQMDFYPIHPAKTYCQCAIAGFDTWVNSLTDNDILIIHKKLLDVCNKKIGLE